MKTLDNTNLGHFISLLKAAFWPKADVDEVDELDIDNVPTENSDNLVKSGGVYSAISSKYTKPATGIPASDLADGVIPPELLYVAEYGVTPYADILAAINAGDKIVVCRLANYVYRYESKTDTTIRFSRVNTGCGKDSVIVDSENVWGSESYGGMFTLDTTNTTSQQPNSNEDLTGYINLHKISKTGNYNDLLNKPSIPVLESMTANEVTAAVNTAWDNVMNA